MSVIKDKAVRNRDGIERIKRMYNLGQIDRETAKQLAKPFIESINADMKKIAKKYGKKPQSVDFINLMR